MINNQWLIPLIKSLEEWAFLFVPVTVAAHDVKRGVILQQETYHEDDAETDGPYAVHVRDCGR